MNSSILKLGISELGVGFLQVQEYKMHQQLHVDIHMQAAFNQNTSVC